MKNTIAHFDASRQTNGSYESHEIYDIKAVTTGTTELSMYTNLDGNNKRNSNMPSERKMPEGQSFAVTALSVKLIPAFDATPQQIQEMNEFVALSRIEFDLNDAKVSDHHLSQLFPNTIITSDTGAPNSVVSSLSINAPSEISLGSTPQLWPQNGIFSYDLLSAKAATSDFTLVFVAKGYWSKINASQVV